MQDAEIAAVDLGALSLLFVLLSLLGLCRSCCHSFIASEDRLPLDFFSFHMLTVLCSI